MESLLVARPGHLYGNGVLGRAAIKTNGNKSSSEEVTNKLQFPLGMRRYQNLLNYTENFFGLLKNLLYRWPRPMSKDACSQLSLQQSPS